MTICWSSSLTLFFRVVVFVDVAVVLYVHSVVSIIYVFVLSFLIRGFAILLSMTLGSTTTWTQPKLMDNTTGSTAQSFVFFFFGGGGSFNQHN